LTPIGRTLVASLLFGIIGGGGLSIATDGGKAFTAEGARRLQALRSPKLVPDIGLVDRHGETIRLRPKGGGARLVEFIYTTCPSICQSAGDSYAKLQERLRAGGYSNPLLLSVTFDLKQDGPAALEAYERWHGADGKSWRIVRPEPHELHGLLDAFGVIVIADPLLGFQHNAAIHLVDQGGRLAGIFDVDDIDGMMARLNELERGST
jgi:protein SCO1/2